MKSRLKAILLQLDTIQLYESKSSEVVDTHSVWLQSDKAKAQMTQFETISDIIQAAKLPTELANIQQLILTWVNYDIIVSPSKEQMAVLMIALILAIEWIEIYCSIPRVRTKVHQSIQELMFQLIPHVGQISVLNTLFLLQCTLSFTLSEEDIKMIKRQEYIKNV